MARHMSKAYVKQIAPRLQRRGVYEPITNQFRFIVRLAHACARAGVPYDVKWYVGGLMASATITAEGAIPAARPLPRPPALRAVAEWRPAIAESVYRLNAYSAPDGVQPGWVVFHSSGLSLVKPSANGEELGADGEDIRSNWRLTHTASGKYFGVVGNFQTAARALLLAASFPVDWTQDAKGLTASPEFRRAGLTVKVQFSRGIERAQAERQLLDLRAA